MPRLQSTFAFMLLLVAAPTVATAAEPPKPAGAGPAAQKQLYTCPMHPQIQWTRPDKCPICEMKLVAKGSAGQAAPEHAGMQMDHQEMHQGHAGMGSTTMGGGCSMCMEMMGMGGMNGGAMQSTAPAGVSAKPMSRSYQARRSSRGCGC